MFLDIFPPLHNNGILRRFIKEIQIKIGMSRILRMKEELLNFGKIGYRKKDTKKPKNRIKLIMKNVSNGITRRFTKEI